MSDEAVAVGLICAELGQARVNVVGGVARADAGECFDDIGQRPARAAVVLGPARHGAHTGLAGRRGQFANQPGPSGTGVAADDDARGAAVLAHSGEAVPKVGEFGIAADHRAFPEPGRRDHRARLLGRRRGRRFHNGRRLRLERRLRLRQGNRYRRRFGHGHGLRRGERLVHQHGSWVRHDLGRSVLDDGIECFRGGDGCRLLLDHDGLLGDRDRFVDGDDRWVHHGGELARAGQQQVRLLADVQGLRDGAAVREGVDALAGDSLTAAGGLLQGQRAVDYLLPAHVLLLLGVHLGRVETQTERRRRLLGAKAELDGLHCRVLRRRQQGEQGPGGVR